MRTSLGPLLTCLLTLSLSPWGASAQPPGFINFESGLVRPLALSADAMTLYAVNAPDGRLEIFDVSGATPALRASVPVGLEPVAVAVQSDSRVWVVNHLSDSVSIVDVAAVVPHVVRTLWVGDEPRDIVFAGAGRGRAFITTAHRGQNTANPRGEYDTPGVGRADVWVFDVASASVGSSVALAPIAVVNLFGDTPRALAVSPSGDRVYASVFLSGNGTTVVSESAVCDGGVGAAPCGDSPGGLPAPNANHAGVPGPEVGLIVRHDGTAFRDELGRDWSDQVRLELPDYDVFEINADASTPAMTRRWSGVGTVNFAMAVHPISGALYVANTEAVNEVRFEGPGTLVREMGLRPGQAASVRGHLHEARITIIDGDTVTPHHLNPHLDYEEETVDRNTRWRTLATPVGLAIDAAGETLYVAALGSSGIGVLNVAALAGGTVSTELSRVISLRSPWPGGPSGLVLDEARSRLFVLNRFDNSVSAVDLVAGTEGTRVRMHTPEPAEVIQGRPILYDALSTSSHGEASCSSCHVFGDLDALAWDLGDPDGDVAPNPNPAGPVGGGQPFHPMKGPMTTQSLRGLSNQGPMHWRGDRTGGHDGDPLDEAAAFSAFNVAFEGLLGRREGALTDAEMARFARFGLSITYPPNPIRQLDNSLRTDEARGAEFFDSVTADTVATCNGCHTYDRASGFFGGDGRTTFENETQHFKIAHLRNVYQKVGMFGMAPSTFFADAVIGNAPMGPQVRGFGFLHDGSTDTVLRFFHATVFTGFTTEQQRADMQAFVMAFDSDLPPIVGQQVTGLALDGPFQTRAQLLLNRAQTSLVWPHGGATRECEVVAHAVVGGELRGWWLNADGLFVPDRASEAPVNPVTLATSISGPITVTCVPPGSGRRMAIDRDSDGALDGDERDAATDPADRALVDIPVIAVLGPEVVTPPVDGGVDLDGGAVADGGAADGGGSSDGGAAGADAGVGADAGPDAEPSGCGCRVGARSEAPAWMGLALLGLLLRRRR